MLYSMVLQATSLRKKEGKRGKVAGIDTCQLLQEKQGLWWKLSAHVYLSVTKSLKRNREAP